MTTSVSSKAWGAGARRVGGSAAAALGQRALHVGRTAAAFGYFGLGSATLGALLLPVARSWPGTPAQKARRARRIVARGLRGFHRAIERLRLGTVDTSAYEAAERAAGGGPCVIVANHPTLLDVTALLACHDDLCVVVKGPMYRNPLVGGLLRACGHVDAGGGGRLDGAAVVKTCLERLQQGCKVLIFPEGTRSPEGGLHQLKRGAFDLALRAEVPVHVIFLRCDPPAAMKGVSWWRAAPEEPFRLRVESVDRIDWRPWAGRGRLLRKHVQAQLAGRVEQWQEQRRCAGAATARPTHTRRGVASA